MSRLLLDPVAVDPRRDRVFRALLTDPRHLELDALPSSAVVRPAVVA